MISQPKHVLIPDLKSYQQSKQSMYEESSKLNEVHQALIELYLDVKVRSNDEILALNDEKLEKEQSKLMEIETLALVEYIKSSIEILLNLKMDASMVHSNRHGRNSHARLIDTDNTSQLDNSQITSSSNFTSVNGGKEPPKAYEEMIQKLENDIRSHIRIEQ
jgi:vacuolar-type H+-ATPase subunit I/STV1